MIKINLLTVERKLVVQPVAAPGINRTLTVSAGLILVLCLAFVGWRYWAVGQDSQRLDADIASARLETERMQSVLAQVRQFEQQKTQLQQRVALIEQLRTNQTGPVHMLDQISRALPATVWLTELKQTPVANEIVIAGRCTTLTGLSDFVGNLEASGYFKKSIEIVSSITEPLAKPPGDVVKFEIKAIFQQPADAGRSGGAAKTAAGATTEN
jgi:type IV pilus assembly protein PilN